MAAYRRYLVGIGAPDGPTKIGAAMATGLGPIRAAKEQNEPDTERLSTEYPGGAWFALNG